MRRIQKVCVLNFCRFKKNILKIISNKFRYFRYSCHVNAVGKAGINFFMLPSK